MLAGLFNITVTAEWCAFISSLFLLPKQSKIWRLFIILLFVTIAAETTGWYITTILKKHENSWVFNINLIVTTLLSMVIFSQAAPIKRIKNKVYLVGLCFMVFAICNIIFFQGFKKYNTATDVTKNIIFILLSCSFFYAAVAEETYRNLFRYEYFWLANGFLFYALGNVVLHIFWDPLVGYYYLTHIDVPGNVNNVLNIILYGSLISAFICCKINTR